MNRRVGINLLFFFAVFVLMLVWAASNVVSVERIERPYVLTADFPAASGVQTRAEVAYLGVHYGTVNHVERLVGKVRVHMKIDRGKKLPVTATANIFRKSAIGEPYIDFFPSPKDHGNGPFLQPGDNVPLARTTVPLEFSELLRSASALVGAIPPERLHTLVHELAVALDNRADDLRQLTISSDELATTFAARTATLDRLAANNTALTHVVTDHRSALGQSIGDLHQLAISLRNAHGDLTTALVNGSQLLDQTAAVVADEKANLDCSLKSLGAVIDVAGSQAHVDDLKRMLDIAPKAYGEVYNSRDIVDGYPWVRVGTITNPKNPPKQYTPPDPIPKVPATPPCRSPLRPSAIGAGSSHHSTAPTPGHQLALASGLALGAGATVVRMSPRSRR